MTANFGVRGVGNDGGPQPESDEQFFIPGEFGFKRAGAKPNYFYLRGGCAATSGRSCGRRDWRCGCPASTPTEPLISNEQFSIGGAESVRGYLESEELGDYGTNGSLEWRTPTWAPRWSTTGLDLYGLVFFDAGIVAIVDPLPEQTSEFTLTSTGVGLRLTGLGGLEAALDWAYPLRSTNSVAAHDARLHFRVVYGF